MRDCLFLVADKNMEGTLKGLFMREAFHRVLGCGRFDFDFRQDLVVAHGQNDPGLYTRANAFLRPYASSHRHAVVIVDAEWDGSPGEGAISHRLDEHLAHAGWGGGNGCAVVIVPELENWRTGELGVAGQPPCLRGPGFRRDVCRPSHPLGETGFLANEPTETPSSQRGRRVGTSPDPKESVVRDLSANSNAGYCPWL